MVLKSQWRNLDSLLPMALSNEENALTNIKNGTSATNIGATKTSEGFDFDGIDDYVDSNYNPSLDSINLEDSNIDIDVFIKETTPYAGMGLFGKEESSNKMFIRDNAGTTIFYWVGSVQVGQYAGQFENNSKYSIVRTDESTPRLFKDGVQISSRFSTFLGLPNANLPIGVYENIVGSKQNYFKGILSIFSAGAAIGVNQVAKNSHYREFLENLGISLAP